SWCPCRPRWLRGPGGCLPELDSWGLLALPGTEQRFRAAAVAPAAARASIDRDDGGGVAAACSSHAGSNDQLVKRSCTGQTVRYRWGSGPIVSSTTTADVSTDRAVIPRARIVDTEVVTSHVGVRVRWILVRRHRSYATALTIPIEEVMGELLA